MKIAGIEWDAGNKEKCQKHGVSVTEIESLLLGTPQFAPDIKHSVAEKRYIAIGRNGKGRVMFVAFTLRHYSDGTYMRPVSARYMHKKEVNSYEKKSS